VAASNLDHPKAAGKRLGRVDKVVEMRYCELAQFAAVYAASLTVEKNTMSFFQRFSKLLGAAVNELFDKATDGMTIPMLKQHIREMEAAAQKARDTHARANATLEIARENRTRIETEAAITEKNIVLILGDSDPSNDHFAEVLGKKLLELEADLELAKQRIEEQALIETQLAQATELINERLIETRQQVRMLDDQAAQAAAMNQAANAIDDVTEALDTGAQAGIDSLGEQVRVDSATARARLSQATAATSATASAEAAIAASRAKDRVDAIRARLAAERATQKG